MAAADLMVLIFEVILSEMSGAYYPYSFLNLSHICKLRILFNCISIDCSVWLTVTFTFDRFITICNQTLRAKYCTEKTAALVITVTCILSIVQNIPVYIFLVPLYIIDNVAWYCWIPSDVYTTSIGAALSVFESIVTPVVPILLIILLNALTIKHIIHANRVRSGLRRDKKDESGADQEVENRRKSIVLLLAISGNFVLLWMVTFVCYMSVNILDVNLLGSDYNDPFTIAELSGYMLRALSACTNTFIYGVSQKKFRDELKNVIKCPFVFFSNSIKCLQ
ncbi:uncharacterized protein LOC144602912 [Rhinoraja longicauda]